jgi:hypothetical protein
MNAPKNLIWLPAVKASMRFPFLLCVLFLSVSDALCQPIEQILIKSQMADEPPTRQGASEYKLAFTKDDTGRFIATEYSVKNELKLLRRPASISNEKINIVNQWLAKDKKSFRLHDFNLTYSALALHADSSKYDLTFNLPSDIVIKVDSFTFCQKHALQRSISTGGFSIEITLINAQGKKATMVFNSDDIGERKFDLQGYLMSYKLLDESVPDDFPMFDFFSKKNLANILFTYQKTVECEGYHYHEFTKQYPRRSSLENRMLVGWNFKKYISNLRTNSIHCHSQIDSLTGKAVYTVADVMAAPVEGYQRLFDEIGKIKYPHYGKLEGKLMLAFIVLTDGTIVGQRLLKGINNATWTSEVFEAVTRVKWMSGKCNGSAVDMLLVLPISVHRR